MRFLVYSFYLPIFRVTAKHTRKRVIFLKLIETKLTIIDISSELCIV